MKKGELVVIGGPMFSGKTTYLIKKLDRFKKKRVLVIKPKIDNRYHADKISAHNGKAFPSTAVDRNNPNSITNLFSIRLSFLFVDEVDKFFVVAFFEYIIKLLVHACVHCPGCLVPRGIINLAAPRLQERYQLAVLIVGDVALHLRLQLRVDCHWLGWCHRWFGSWFRCKLSWT